MGNRPEVPRCRIQPALLSMPCLCFHPHRLCILVHHHLHRWRRRRLLHCPIQLASRFRQCSRAMDNRPEVPRCRIQPVLFSMPLLHLHLHLYHPCILIHLHLHRWRRRLIKKKWRRRLLHLRPWRRCFRTLRAWCSPLKLPWCQPQNENCDCWLQTAHYTSEKAGAHAAAEDFGGGGHYRQWLGDGRPRRAAEHWRRERLWVRSS